MSFKYRTLFPDVQIRRDSSGKSKYDTTRGGERRTTSTNAGITGKHGHVIINDDPLDYQQAESEAYRKQAINKIKALSSRKKDKSNTPVMTIMQRLHENDVTGWWLKNKGDNVRHICLPSELSNAVKPASLKEHYIDGLLDPDRMSRSVLKEAQTDLGSRGYACQYMQSPTVEGGNIVKYEWFGHVSIDKFLAIVGTTPMHFFLDTAYDEKRRGMDNDPSGIIAACKIQNNLYIAHGEKVYMEFPDLCRWISSYVQRHGYTQASTIRIEPKANGKSVIQQLRAETKLNVTQTPPPSESKMLRLATRSPKIECGRVVLVDGAWTDEFTDEVCGFPAKAHDEYVDVLCYAIDYLLTDDDDDTSLDAAFFYEEYG